MKKTGLNIYIYDFYVDYEAIAVDDMLDIQKYLMKKKCLDLLKKAFFTGLTILSSVNMLSANSLSAALLKCISMNNKKCK